MDGGGGPEVEQRLVEVLRRRVRRVNVRGNGGLLSAAGYYFNCAKLPHKATLLLLLLLLKSSDPDGDSAVAGDALQPAAVCFLSVKKTSTLAKQMSGRIISNWCNFLFFLHHNAATVTLKNDYRQRGSHTLLW